MYQLVRTVNGRKRRKHILLQEKGWTWFWLLFHGVLILLYLSPKSSVTTLFQILATLSSPSKLSHLGAGQSMNNLPLRNNASSPIGTGCLHLIWLLDFYLFLFSFCQFWNVYQWREREKMIYIMLALWRLIN